ncbi:GvpL/GvpF family gas vesicle protein [Jiangella aurantiaca]|uniref:GvpL/GvpF family gas vesicle protein n=1 Tax=Jiangella aurantiaca TaxID=2530373 RepID=A0A4V2YSS3_9ACTN|nr:GvpL/GvpF family gas vesicle protein [Jiangella aurantiaca]TDD71037.1 GvpL/GvpF family gas vesicle protein [Jiangella aurantiaca]
MTLTEAGATMDEGSAGPAPLTAQYVYAIVPAGTSAPDELTGIDDGDIELIAHGPVAAVVGKVVTDRAFGRRDDLLAHSRVTDTLAQRCPVIPVRFGSVVTDTGAVVGELLEPNTEFFASVLDELSGHRQYVVRARYDEEAVLAEIVRENPEIAALREDTRDHPVEATWNERIRLGELVARALEVKRDVDSAALLDLLVPAAEAWNIRAAGEVDHLIDVAFLVADEQLDAFDQAAEQAARNLAGRARVRLIGPTAPYDFVPDDDSWAS